MKVRKKLSANKVSLQLPQIQLAAKIECRSNDDVECSIEILDYQMLSLNLFDARSFKYFLRFSAKVQINFTIRGREESVVIVAEDFELSSVDTIGDPIFDFDFEELTISKEELSDLLDEETVISFYTITD